MPGMVSTPPEDDPGHHIDVERVVVEDPRTTAAGFGGIRYGLEPVLRQVGVRRGARILRDLNQPGGIDCPGCAWPEREDPSNAEFCENGAKAVAEEATRRRVDPGFFAAHPVAELAARRDWCLGPPCRNPAPVHRRKWATHYQPPPWSQPCAPPGAH